MRQQRLHRGGGSGGRNFIALCMHTPYTVYIYYIWCMRSPLAVARIHHRAPQGRRCLSSIYCCRSLIFSAAHRLKLRTRCQSHHRRRLPTSKKSQKTPLFLGTSGFLLVETTWSPYPCLRAGSPGTIPCTRTLVVDILPGFETLSLMLPSLLEKKTTCRRTGRRTDTITPAITLLIIQSFRKLRLHHFVTPALLPFPSLRFALAKTQRACCR